MTKVLVFESDPGFAGELRSELGRLGCTVQVVDDGNVGLQAASAERPDLILLSIELPRMNGFSVCNKLKKDSQLKGVPLLIMSSESSEETFEQHRKLRTRAEDYVHKPIAFGELLQHIRALVPMDGVPDSEGAIVIDDSEVLVDESSTAGAEEHGALVTQSPREDEADGQAAPPPPQPPPAPATKGPDAEIDAFIGGAFSRLLGGGEEEEPTMVRPMPAEMAAALAGQPASPPTKKATIPPPLPKASSSGHEAPASVPPTAEFRVTDAGTNKQADGAATNERLRHDMDRSKDEVVRLTKELTDAHATSRRLENELASMGDAPAEIARLRREVEELRGRLAAGGKGGVSSREFLDLREALNKKEKELLSLRDQISRKDKDALSLQDQNLSLEREKADQVDKLLELERAKSDLEGVVDSLRADKDLATKRGEDFRARGEKLSTQLTNRESEIAQAKAAMAETLASHEAAMRKAAEERAASEAALVAEAGRRHQDAERSARERLEAAETAAQRALEASEAAGNKAVSEAQSAGHQALERAVADARARGEAAVRDTSAQMSAAHVAETERLATEHDAALQLRAQDYAKALAARERELSEGHSTKVAQLESQHRDTVSSIEAAAALATRKAEAAHAQEIERKDAAHAKERADKDAAWAAARKDLETEVRALSLDLEQTRDKLDASNERALGLDQSLTKTTAGLADTSKRLDDTEDKRATLEATLATRTQERDATQKELAQRTADLTKTREALEASDQRSASLAADLRARTEERDGARAEVDRLTHDLEVEAARLQKARAKWGEDRASLERAREALSAAIGQIQEAEGRPLD